MFARLRDSQNVNDIFDILRYKLITNAQKPQKVFFC